MKNLVKIKSFKCSACEEVFKIDVSKDQRGLFDSIECEKCGSLAKVFVDKTEVIGDIEDIENNNETINF